MNAIDRFNHAIDYIEAHLTEEIDLNQVAQIACCSVSHFQRMFSYITEISLSEYIRRRRLTLAAFDLQVSGEKVIDVAAKYGYQAPEAFSRAFKSHHGVMPTLAKNLGVSLKAYPRLSFHMFFDGDDEIQYQIKKMPSFNICGIKTDITNNSERIHPEITKFWEENINNGVVDRFHRAIGLDLDTPLKAVLFNYTSSRFSYMIGYDLPDNVSSPPEYFLLHVPAQTWAVFYTKKHPGHQTTRIVRRMRERILLEWFPTSGYVHANGPEIEIFNRDEGVFVIEVWIPVVQLVS